MATHRNICIFMVGAVYEDVIILLNEFPQPDTKTKIQSIEYRMGGNSFNSLAILSQLVNKSPPDTSISLDLVTSLAKDDWLLDNTINPIPIPGVSCRFCAVVPSGNYSPPKSFILSTSDSRTVLSENSLPDLTAKDFELGVLAYLRSIFSSPNECSSPQIWLHFEGRNVAHLPDMLAKATTLQASCPTSQIIISLEIERPERTILFDLVPEVDVCFFATVMADHYGFAGRYEAFLHWSLGHVKPPRRALHTLTLGANGAMAALVDANGHISVFHQNAPPSPQVVDTVGAGDTFVASCIASLSWGATSTTLFPESVDVQSVLREACTLATRKCGQHGFDHLCD